MTVDSFRAAMERITGRPLSIAELDLMTSEKDVTAGLIGMWVFRKGLHAVNQDGAWTIMDDDETVVSKGDTALDAIANIPHTFG